MSKRTTHSPMSDRAMNEALIELRKNTSLITSLMYYMKPSEERNRRNQRNKKKA